MFVYINLFRSTNCFSIPNDNHFKLNKFKRQLLKNKKTELRNRIQFTNKNGNLARRDQIVICVLSLVGFYKYPTVPVKYFKLQVLLVNMTNN